MDSEIRAVTKEKIWENLCVGCGPSSDLMQCVCL